MDPDLFFPPDDTDTHDHGPESAAGDCRAQQVASAKAVCARCPVRRPCLAEALEAIPYGVAGGLDEHERRRLAADGTGRRRWRLGAVWPVAATRGDAAEGARAAVRAGEDRRWVAIRFGVSVRTVERWIAAGVGTDSAADAEAGPAAADVDVDVSAGGAR